MSQNQISNLDFAHFLVYCLFVIFNFTEWTRLNSNIAVTDRKKNIVHLLAPNNNNKKKSKQFNFYRFLWL